MINNGRAIYFDMDGTIADFYGVEGWLNDLENYNTRPYAVAKPLLRMSSLAKRLNNLQRMGYVIGIVSWTSKSGTPSYNAEVTKVKQEWLKAHLPSVKFDEIHIVPYGTPKSKVVKVRNGIIFDDEERNRKEWDIANELGFAFDVNNIMEVLKALN